MIERFSVRTFKSLEDVTVELGQVNVFIGANGSGKSNLLEALGILSAAADGKVDDQALLARGVRLGAPKRYKSAFPAQPGKRIPAHLSFEVCGSSQAEYKVCLWNNLKDPDPAWTFKTESWKEKDRKLVGRSPASKKKTDEKLDRNKQRGFAALKAVEVAKGPALSLLKALQSYVIFSPATAVLRGIALETQPRTPVGLSGGNLLPAIHNLLRQRREDERVRKICKDTLELIDWAKAIKSLSNKTSMMTSIQFRDRFMKEGQNLLSAYEASEGALYALFLAVIAGHKDSPRLCAVDNADHSLNPRLARALMECLCQWYMAMEEPRQILLTTHNPLILDGLPLQDDRVRLFTVSRTDTGRTSIRRVVVEGLLEKAERGWSLSRLWVMGHLGGVPDV
ncbi:hypothetical protein BO91_01810 [Candidatus Synechococcus spongiarum LMB bulk10E]|nr:hypothetical protein BO91_01810 [Candidatus Synechococcus spongiarum LMB bulk10E]